MYSILLFVSVDIVMLSYFHTYHTKSCKVGACRGIGLDALSVINTELNKIKINLIYITVMLITILL